MEAWGEIKHQIVKYILKDLERFLYQIKNTSNEHEDLDGEGGRMGVPQVIR